MKRARIKKRDNRNLAIRAVREIWLDRLGLATIERVRKASDDSAGEGFKARWFC